MICPRKGCGGKTRVLKTWHESGYVIRKRGCKSCGLTFNTTEQRATREWVPSAS